jgi:xylose isomerase
MQHWPDIPSLMMSVDAGLLGSVDANRGNPQNGWDTDQFPTDMNDCIQAMLIILAAGGLHSGGLNFDAKLRRESVDLEDMFTAHIGGMDSFARGLIVANQIISDNKLGEFKSARYASFDSGRGAEFRSGSLSLLELRDHAANVGEPPLQSGKQEYVENLLNDYAFKGVNG